MPFVPVPDVVQVEAIFEMDGQTIENTMYFAANVAIDEGSISDLLETIRTVIETDLLPTLSTAIALVRLVGTLLTAIDSLSVTLNVSPPLAGESASEVLPNNVAYCVTFLTSARGRSARGRNYIAGLTVGSVTGNNIDAGARTAILSYYDEVKAATNAINWVMGVVSRFADGEPREVGLFRTITGFTTFDTVLDSQRRRLPGRGM